MVEQTVTIQNRLGLHARACSVFVKEAAKFASHVYVARDGIEVNGKSILGVMMLAAEMGARITIKADGKDEQEALQALVRVVNDKFGEE
ncbi:MAG: HPr family phosphocarrier protein [Candidatus Eisenbacteria bacterium]|uniref:HPr family phosphocarrier protein n=1 Tax=Eiseniibacteriota bacterium TaxID=2212470 RepID=A0A538SAP3_UNCEI|nr:MAG: HPr family phosphocarrier protein [Candidatus Eisenbacteria bacterium]TMQ54970.1 MAG: HPr family phosphocarrier protein [Candidatus Eisenbacteria bacterium]